MTFQPKKPLLQTVFSSTEIIVKLRFFPKSVMKIKPMMLNNKMVGFSSFP